jgi:cytoplasmic iron level regulating protein YaaA (DUF328/UPF0246 family)
MTPERSVTQSNLERLEDRHKEDINKLWESLAILEQRQMERFDRITDKLEVLNMSRAPKWATQAIAALSGLIGLLVAVVAALLKIAFA